MSKSNKTRLDVTVQFTVVPAARPDDSVSARPLGGAPPGFRWEVEEPRGDEERIRAHRRAQREGRRAARAGLDGAVHLDARRGRVVLCDGALELRRRVEEGARGDAASARRDRHREVGAIRHGEAHRRGRIAYVLQPKRKRHRRGARRHLAELHLAGEERELGTLRRATNLYGRGLLEHARRPYPQGARRHLASARDLRVHGFRGHGEGDGAVRGQNPRVVPESWKTVVPSMVASHSVDVVPVLRTVTVTAVASVPPQSMAPKSTRGR